MISRVQSIASTARRSPAIDSDLEGFLDEIEAEAIRRERLAKIRAEVYGNADARKSAPTTSAKKPKKRRGRPPHEITTRLSNIAALSRAYRGELLLSPSVPKSALRPIELLAKRGKRSALKIWDRLLTQEKVLVAIDTLLPRGRPPPSTCNWEIRSMTG